MKNSSSQNKLKISSIKEFSAQGPHISNVFYHKIKKIKHIPNVKTINIFTNSNYLQILSYNNHISKREITSKISGSLSPVAFKANTFYCQKEFDANPEPFIHKIDSNSPELLPPYYVSRKSQSFLTLLPSKPNLAILPALILY